MDDDLPSPVEKLSISGPTLAALLHSFSSSAADVDGLLFGHITRLPQPDLRDDDDDVDFTSSTSTTAHPSSSTPLAATISGHLCFCSPMSFYDPLGRIDRGALSRSVSADQLPHNSSLLGWFSGRRQSPLRPSMREYSVTVSLARTLKTLALEGESHQDPGFRPPCVFLLLSTSVTGNLAVHTHEYRAFEIQKKGRAGGGGDRCLVPRSLSVVNVGPAFRGQYGSFSPDSGFPVMSCELEKKGEGDGKNLIGIRNQKVLDRVAEGFGVDRLRQMVGHGAVQYKTELEELYGNMLHKLEALAGLVEKSSNKVFEQERQNFKLRSKVAGFIE